VEERVITEARRAIEAVVMAAVEPVEPQVLAQLVEIPVSEVEQVCADLVEEYERDGRGFTLARVAGGYRYQTHTDMAPYVERFVLEGQTVRLSPAALETLAIIAYRQPITLPEIQDIRGVNSSSVLKTLFEKKLITTAGKKPVVGTPFFYRTTQDFLMRFGLNDLAELPKPEDLDADLAATVEAREIAAPTAAATGIHLETGEEPDEAEPGGSSPDGSGPTSGGGGELSDTEGGEPSKG
jgi:segregation and condensation protein B